MCSLGPVGPAKRAFWVSAKWCRCLRTLSSFKAKLVFALPGAPAPRLCRGVESGSSEVLQHPHRAGDSEPKAHSPKGRTRLSFAGGLLQTGNLGSGPPRMPGSAGVTSCCRAHMDERIQARSSGHSPVSGALGTNSPPLPGGVIPAAPAGPGRGAVRCGRRGQGRRLEERREEARRKPEARSPPTPHPPAWRAASGPRKPQLKWRHASCLRVALTSAPGGLLLRPSHPPPPPS